MVYTEMDLFLAIKYNHYPRVYEILRNFDLANHEFFDDKITFISLAVLNNCNEAIMEKLIEYGGDINRLSYINYEWPSEGKLFTSFETALITATRHGNSKLCEFLCKKKAKVNKIDSFNMTALHWAASLNLVDIVEILFKHDANPNILDLKNKTPTEIAIQNSNTEIVNLFAQQFSLEFKFREYLMAAIQYANNDIFKILLKQTENGKVNVDLNLIDDSVGSLLHHAVILSNLNNEFDRSKSTIEIVENLVEKENVEVNIINKYGETPLHMCRNVQVVRLLLEKGAKMNICEISGKMPFFSFILKNSFDMCLELIKNGCILKNRDKLGNSLLYTLINSNAPVGLILLLLEAGVDLDEEWILQKNYPKKLKDHPKLVNAIEDRLRNPRSLKELSRKALRTHLIKINRSKSILKSINGLEKMIPSSLQDYVCLNLKNKYESILIK